MHRLALYNLKVATIATKANKRFERKYGAFGGGGLDRTRTYYPLIRNQVLYPDELQDHSQSQYNQ